MWRSAARTRPRPACCATRFWVRRQSSPAGTPDASVGAAIFHPSPPDAHRGLQCSNRGREFAAITSVLAQVLHDIWQGIEDRSRDRGAAQSAGRRSARLAAAIPGYGRLIQSISDASSEIGGLMLIAKT